MTSEQAKFIDAIGAYVQRYAPQYGICVCSPIIGQAILESAWGTDYKATYGHNYFGLKFRENRCPISCGRFLDGSAEQAPDGSYTDITDFWFRFRSMEEGVIGYFQFVSAPAYTALKGLTDPWAYLEAVKAAHYASSLDYVARVMAVVDKYDLRRFDPAESGEKEEKKHMVINVHAGHNPDGRVACGAVGIIRESTEARRVKDAVISGLRRQGHTVYDCTCEDGVSVSDVLTKIVSRCNSHTADLDVSIHFNAGAGDAAGNGRTTGVEVYTYDSSGIARDSAERVCDAVSALGFRNRGAKINRSLYVLRNTKAPAMLIECCFVDDRDDVQLYDCQRMADAIVYGITGQQAPEQDPDPADQGEETSGAETSVGDKKQLCRVQVGAYAVEANAVAMQARLKAAGFDAIIVKA